MSLARFINVGNEDIVSESQDIDMFDAATELSEQESLLAANDDDVVRLDDTVAAVEDICTLLSKKDKISDTERTMLQIMNRLSVSGTGIQNPKIVSGLENFNGDRVAALEAAAETVRDGMKSMVSSVASGFGIFATISEKISKMFASIQSQADDLRRKYAELSKSGAKTTSNYTAKTQAMRIKKFTDFKQGVKFVMDGMQWHANFVGEMVKELEATEKDYTKWDLFKGMFSYNEETAREYYEEVNTFVANIGKSTNATLSHTFKADIYRIQDPVFASAIVVSVPNAAKFRGNTIAEMKNVLNIFRVGHDKTQSARPETNIFASVKLADVGVLLDAADEAASYMEKQYNAMATLNRRVEVKFNRLMNILGTVTLFTGTTIIPPLFFFFRFMKRMIAVHNNIIRKMIGSGKSNALRLGNNILAEADSLLNHSRWA